MKLLKCFKPTNLVGFLFINSIFIIKTINMKIKITESQLKMCVGKTLNEQAYAAPLSDDEGAPPTYSYEDFQKDYEPDEFGADTLKRYLEDRDIALETYDGEEYFIRSHDGRNYLIYPEGEGFEIYISGNDKEREEKFKVEDAVQAVRLLLKYKDNFYSFDEANHKRRDDYNDSIQDKYVNNAEPERTEMREQGLGDYPPGAANDPRAPWNQEDEPEPELEDIEIVDDDVSDFEDVWVIFINDRGGEYETRLDKILEALKPHPEIMDYFNKAIKIYPRPEDWEKKVRFIAELYAKKFDIEYEGGREYESPSADDYADDYRDEY